MRFGIEIGGGGVKAGGVADVTTAGFNVVLPVQTHSCNVGVIPMVDNEDISADYTAERGLASEVVAGNRFEDTDALICLRPGVVIGVRTADCVPLLLNAPDIRGVAAIHAGWKGSLHGIVTVTVERLKALGADPRLIHAAFGPSICGGCYQVSRALAEDFRRAGFGNAIITERNVDLQEVNRLRLLEAGVESGNIRLSDYCTLQTPWLPSWRRGATDRRLLSWITLVG